MLVKEPTKRSSSYSLLTKYRNKFLEYVDSPNLPQVKYSPVKTISKIELTLDQSENHQNFKNYEDQQLFK